MKLSTQTKLLFAALAVTALSACGGGGASAPAPAPVAATPTPAPAPAPVAAPSPAPAPAITQTATVSPAPSPAPSPVAQPTPAVLQLSVPTPTYTATSAEKQVYDLLNKERGRCGFGLLAQDAKLDLAAKNHANYLSLNNVIQHEEDLTKPGFTGATPAARGANVGYGQIVGEVITGGSSPTYNLRRLLSAPYHLAALMMGYSDVGVSYFQQGLLRSTGDKSDILVVEFGLKSASDMQLLASNSVGVYPCSGSTDVNYGLYAETPSPVVGRDLLNQPIGTPYLLSMNVGTTITISTAQLIEVATGNAVTLREPMTKTNDPNARLLSFQAIIMPDARLKASTSYKYMVTGTSTGVMANGATIGDCTTTASGSFTCVSTFTTRAEAGVL